MVAVELYSQRRRREGGEVDDVVQYTELSSQLRQQCIYIIGDLYEHPDANTQYKNYYAIVSILRRELGVQKLVGRQQPTIRDELEQFIITAPAVEALDAIELCLRLGRSIFVAEYGNYAKIKFSRACEEFNVRCRRSGFGYSFEQDSLFRVDSHLLHKEAVIPALVVLSDAAFSVPDREFRNAHEHWRAGKLPEVLIDCLKAFESTIKIIVAERGWALPERPTATQLVQALFDNSFLPGFYQSQMGGLRSLLESGIPTPRNRTAGHGGGTEQPQLPVELVRYVLHQTAATILYLVDTHRART